MPTMPRFVSQEVRLQARNIAETVAFYRDVLGFTVDTTWGPETDLEGCILDRDGVHLLFHKEAEGEPKMTGVVVINVEDVLELHERLAGKAKVVWGPEVYSYRMREFAVEDPNGYQIAFCERTDDPPTCDAR